MDLMELFVKIGADTSGLDSGMNQAESKAGSFATKLGSGLKTAAKVGAAAVTAASAAVVSLTKNAVENYAEYEQLVGGVETLFKDSADTVMNYAENAYKTAGLSANQYMETVTSFSASLLQSLDGDTELAAKYADEAITDMSDNANKMGTSMESIQNAYQGFAKQNYTMLDNLKLGYGGTKEEMERLLRDAEKMEGYVEGSFDLSNYADIVDAIHIVQENMGITGTTAKEASSTISGSLGMLKSSWQNLVTGIADPNADLGKLIDNLVDSAGTAANNLIPVVEKALSGIAKLVERLAPVISEKLPSLVTELVPPLLSAATQLVNALVGVLPDLFSLIVEQVPTIFTMIVPTFVSMLPQIVDLGLDLILALADGIIDALPDLIPALVDVILTIVDKLTDPDTITKLIGASLQIILALAEGLIKALPNIISKVPVIIGNLVEAFFRNAPMMLEGAGELIAMLATGLVEGLAQIVQIGKDLVSGLWNGIKDSWKDLKENVKGLAGDLVNGIKDKFGIHSPSKVFAEIGRNLDEGLSVGITRNIKTVDDAFGQLSDYTSFVGSGFSTPALATAGAGYGQSNAGINGTFVIPVYIGGDKIDEKIINAIDAYNFKSGGRA